MMTGYPCPYCRVNSWTSCKHRQAERPEPVLKKSSERVYVSGGGCYKLTPTMRANL